MSVKKVQFSINGQTYDLTYDAGSQQYKATITAPSTTSYNENEEHKFYGTVTAEDDAGNRVTATKDEFEELKLRVLEKEKPVIAVTYPTAGAYITSAAPVFKWNVTDTGSGIDTSSISIKIDGNTAVTSGIETSSISNGYAVHIPLRRRLERVRTPYISMLAITTGTLQHRPASHLLWIRFRPRWLLRLRLRVWSPIRAAFWFPETPTTQPLRRSPLKYR